jgi:4-amino-4-deoxy-L-arabinose transferase-like glycosyltransferase
LGSFAIRWWDESMFAVNTYEMLHNGKYFSLYFDLIPDLYNTKPPLTSWLQLISVKLFGFSEFSIRFPSALASAAVIFIVFFQIKKYFGLVWAWTAALILLTSTGFIHFHTSRTGDSDAILTLFSTLSTVYFLKYIFEDHKKYILYFFIFISLAFAAKLYAALLFAPALLLILVWQKKFFNFITNFHFLLGSVIFILSAVALIYLRELDTPGFVHEILFKDAGRMFKTVENHKEPFFFYIDQLIEKRYTQWFIFFFLTLLATNKNIKLFLSCMFLLVASYLLIISIFITKLEWYDMPLFPMFSIIAAYPFYCIFNYLENDEKLKDKMNFKYISAAILMVFASPFVTVFNSSQSNSLSSGEKKLEANERFIFRKLKQGFDFKTTHVYNSSYKGGLLFYKYRLKEKNQQLIITQQANFKKGDQILVCNDSLITILKTTYNMEEVDKFESAILYKIN